MKQERTYQLEVGFYEQLRRRHAPGARTPREAPPRRSPSSGGYPRVSGLPRGHGGAGHDRGGRIVRVPAEPLELVARPHLRGPAPVRVRRPGLPPHGLAARPADGRRLDLRGVRGKTGRPPSRALRVYERRAPRPTAGHGERVPPAHRGAARDQLRGRDRGRDRRDRRHPVRVPEAVHVHGASRRRVRETRSCPRRDLEGQPAPRVRPRAHRRGLDAPRPGTPAAGRPRVCACAESLRGREGRLAVRRHLLRAPPSPGAEVVPRGRRHVPRRSGFRVRAAGAVREEPPVRRLPAPPDRGAPDGRHRAAAQAGVRGGGPQSGVADGTRRAHGPRWPHGGRGPKAERVPRIPRQSREGLAMKIGEIVAASVIDGLIAKLQLHNPEELRIAYPVIVEGARYDFYCLVEDVINEPSDIADQLAGSSISDVIVPRPETHEGYGGPIFYSKAKLRMIQLVDRDSKKLSEPQTIPPYFSGCRHATREDVERIYEVTESSSTLGTITGVEPFYVQLDMGQLVEKPFAIFGRTGTGKSILNKLVCVGILARSVGSVLIFDMHGEYGIHSQTDSTEGLKFFFPGKVEIFSLDPKNKEAKPFVLDTREITPEDLVVALQDLTSPMVDTLYEIAKSRAGRDLISAVKDSTMEALGQERAHEMSLQGLKRRIGRLDRLPFLKEMKEGRDAFQHILAAIREGKSVVLDFGDYGTDQMVYLFVANILSRRLFELYTERNEDLPRLVLFLEEAHKFLSPEIAPYAHTFSRLARETRKFNLILALIDQRPSRISDEVRSQLANRLVMSLKEPSDVEAALAGVPDKKMWENIIAKLPLRTVAVIGDAIRIPTVIDVLEYDNLSVREHVLGPRVVDEGTVREIAKRADDIFGRG
ncbi:MAG: DUF87 domain-containing protein [Methanobacteriota archaeon]|nr:MAG: DUF87 domain-containing protein [Euryarchaeota archaeon]